MMRVSFNAKSSQLTEKQRDYAERKLQRLSRYFQAAREAHVTHSEMRGRHQLEVQLDLDGMLLRAEERHPDWHAATDAVVDKLEEQVRRLKDKLKSHKGKPSAVSVAAMTSALSDLPDEDEAGESAPSIVRKKRFAIKPMTVDEAALQMELLHHDFFAFLNAESDLVSVVYRRRDGNLGLLEMDG